MSKQSIEFTYTNWRGVTEHRSVDPINIWYGSTKWHPDGDQWFLHAIDLNKSSGPNRIKRDFPLSGIFALPFTEENFKNALYEAFTEGRVYQEGSQKLAEYNHFEAIYSGDIRAPIPAISKLRKAIGE